jgi:hypothetical protein
MTAEQERALIQQIADLYKQGFTEVQLRNPKTMKTKDLTISVKNEIFVLVIQNAAP